MINVPHRNTFSEKTITHAIVSLIKALNLPRTASDDWAMDTADQARIGEFCAHYSSARLTKGEKFVLMELIVASLDDYECNCLYREYDPTIRNTVEQLLRNDFALHERTIKAWCRFDSDTTTEGPESLDDGIGEDKDHTWVFQITPIMRCIWMDHQKHMVTTRPSYAWAR